MSLFNDNAERYYTYAAFIFDGDEIEVRGVPSGPTTSFYADMVDCVERKTPKGWEPIENDYLWTKAALAIIAASCMSPAPYAFLQSL
jgi:hypothetical protein